MASIGIGVIGLGRMGSVYASHIAHQVEGAKLVAVSDSRPEASEKFTSQISGLKAYENYQDLLNDPQVQGIVITTPTSTHKEVTIAAAQAGKAIFCEKPTALTLQATDEMVEAVEKAGVMFQVGFMRRFDKGYMAAKQKIEEGIIGTPVQIRSVSRDPFRTSLEYASPSNSGGIIVDMGIHDIDICRWMMSDDIERVYTEAGVLVFPELAEVGDVDNTQTVLKFTRGGLGNIETSRNARYGYDIQCDILGSEGALRVGYLQETPVLTLTRQGVTHDVVPHFPERFGAAYTAQVEYFVECLKEDKPPKITIQDARIALQVAIAATQSQHTGQVVKVSDVK